MKSHYEVLGLGPDADLRQIKVAFRQIAQDCHPDRNPDPAAHARMSAASAAWSVLKSPAARAEYDAELASQVGPKRRARKTPPPPAPCVSCGEPSFQQSTKCWKCLLREAVEEEGRRRAEEEAKRRDEAARARAESARRRWKDAQVQAEMREQALNDQRKNAEGTTDMHGYDDPIHAPDSATLFEAILSESALRAARGVKRDGVNVWLHITPDMGIEAKGSTVELAKEVHKGLRQANRLLDRVSKWFGGR